jgi:hypothetical protein
MECRQKADLATSACVQAHARAMPDTKANMSKVRYLCDKHECESRVDKRKGGGTRDTLRVTHMLHRLRDFGRDREKSADGIMGLQNMPKA